MRVFSTELKLLHEPRCHRLREWQNAGGIAMAVNGDAFVADADSIVVCRPNGEFVRRISPPSGHSKTRIFANYVAVNSKPGLLFVTANG